MMQAETWLTGDVSIRTPHMGRVANSLIGGFCNVCFNPHAPYGARQKQEGGEKSKALFQSARPIWGASYKFEDHNKYYCVSIRTPHMGRVKKC